MTTIALPPNFTDAAAIQIGPRSFRLAIETSTRVFHEQHGWVTAQQYCLDDSRRFRTAKDAIDAAEAMREVYHTRFGVRYVRAAGPQDHTITVHMNSRRIEQYRCQHADEPYRLVP